MYNKKLKQKGIVIALIITISSFPLSVNANDISSIAEDAVIETEVEIKNDLEIVLDTNDDILDFVEENTKYESISVTTIGERKLMESDFDVLNKLNPKKLDLSKANANAIPANAFMSSKELLSFKFPQGILEIGDRAFYECSGLIEALIIPETVVSIGSESFYKCSGIKGDLIISDSIRNVGKDAFLFTDANIFILISESDVISNYRKDIVDNLPLENTYIEYSYSLSLEDTWLNEDTHKKLVPTLSAYMGEVENGQGVGVSLTIPSIYKTENITIIRNGEQYSLPELKDNKYTFSEPGNYTVTMESINGTKSEVVFRNISPLLAPSIEYSNNKVSLVNNGTIESREATPRLEYRIGDSEWITYNNEFDLIATYGSRMIVEARAVNDEFTSDITEKNITSHALTENVLSMTLSTNTITFENFSSMQDTTKEKAVTITVSSSLGYQINAYLMSEIQNSDKSLTLNKSMLKIKESTKSSYSTFPSVGEKVVLREGNPAGEKITHDIDLLLSSGTYQVDVYKTSIKLEIEQN